MASPEDEQSKRAYLDKHQFSYYPAREHNERLGRTTIVAVSGAAFAGRATFIDAVHADPDTDIQRLPARTTRARRAGDTDDLQCDTPVDLFLDAQEAGDLLRYDVRNNEITGTFMDDLPPVETLEHDERAFYVGPITLLSIEQLFGTDADIRSVLALADTRTYRHRLGLDRPASPDSPLASPSITERLRESQALLNNAARNASAEWLTAIPLSDDRESLLDISSSVARAAFTRTHFDVPDIDTMQYIQQMRRVIDEALNKVQ